MKCILSDRLYVPEEYVTQESLAAYTFVRGDDDGEDYSAFEGYQETFRRTTTGTIACGTITAYKKYNLDGQIYYGFSRGNLPVLFEHFGAYEWVNQMSAPPFTHPLDFRSDRSLYTYEKDGRGQQEAIAEWLSKRYGIIRAAPRFGKTISAIYTATHLKVKTLIIAHQIELLRQFHQSVLDFTNVRELWAQYGLISKFASSDTIPKPKDASKMVVGFFNDHANPEELDICLMSWQKFASKYGPERIRDYQNTWGLVIVDECHKAAALKFAGVVNSLNSEHRLGLTGTVERKDGMEFIAKHIIGPVTAEGRVKQVPCKVQVYQTGYNIPSNIMEPHTKVMQRFGAWSDRSQRIRDMIIADAAAGNYICVAYHSSSNEQLLAFVESLQFGLSLEDKRVGAFWGKAPGRKKLMEEVVNGDIHVLVCNSQMLTGIDVPRWNMYYSMFPESNVVFNDEGKLSGNYYQKFSRVRTPFTYENGNKKMFGVIKDFVDDGSFARGSFHHRLKAYQHQGFQIEFIKWKKEEKNAL